MRKFRRDALIIAISAIFVSGFLAYLIGAISPNIAVSFGYKKKDASIILLFAAINLVGYLFGSLLSGYFIKKFTIKKFLLFLIALAIIASTFIAFLGNFLINTAGTTFSWVIFAISNLANGFSFGAIVSCVLYLAVLIYRPLHKSEKWVALFNSFFNTGAVIGTILSGLVLNSLNSSSWYVIFYVAVGAMITIFFLILFININEKYFNEASKKFIHKDDVKETKTISNLGIYKTLSSNINKANKPFTLGVALVAMGLLCYLLLQGFMTFWLPDLIASTTLLHPFLSNATVSPFVVAAFWFGTTVILYSYAFIGPWIHKHISMPTLLCFFMCFGFLSSVLVVSFDYNEVDLIIFAFFTGIGCSILYPLTYSYAYSMTSGISPLTSAILTTCATSGVIFSNIFSFLINFLTHNAVLPFFIVVGAFAFYLILILGAKLWKSRNHHDISISKDWIRYYQTKL